MASTVSARAPTRLSDAPGSASRGAARRFEIRLTSGRSSATPPSATPANTTALSQIGAPTPDAIVAANAPAARKMAKNAWLWTSRPTSSNPATSQTTQNHMLGVYPRHDRPKPGPARQKTPSSGYEAPRTDFESACSQSRITVWYTLRKSTVYLRLPLSIVLVSDGCSP